MSIASAILTRATSPTPEGNWPLSAAALLGWMQGTPTATGKRITEEQALKIGAVYSCVQILSGTIGSLPLPLLERLEPTGKRRATDHYLYPILHDRPNPWMNAYTFRETMAGHRALWGNAFAEILRDDNGRVTGLFPLRPDRMERPKMAESGDLLYRYTLPTGRQIVLPQNRVHHIRGLSSDGIWGYSPIALQREGLALALTGEEFAARFFGSGARPGGVLQSKGKLSQDAAERMGASWNQAHQGLENSHRVAILEEGVEWKAVGMPLEDAQFLEMRKYQRAEIAGWYLIPPHMIGDVDRSTSWGSGIEQQTQGFINFTLRPWTVNWEQQVSFDLLSDAERPRFFAEFLFDALLRGDSAARGEFYAKMFGVGALSINQILEKENQNPIANGDEHFVPLNFAPLSQVVGGGGSGQGQQQPANGSGAAGADVNALSGMDSVEISRLLLNIERLEALGMAAEAEKSRQTLSKLILSAPGSDEEQSGRSGVEQRSLAGRYLLRATYRPLLLDAFERVVKSEISTTRRQARKLLGTRTSDDFLTWLERYHADELQQLVEQSAMPALAAYSAAVEREVLDELKIAGLPETGQAFLEAYALAMALGYVGRSLGQMRQLVRDAVATGTDPLEAVEGRLTEWAATRAGRVADIETVRAGEGFARNAYKRGGVQRLKWRARGRNCPYCSRLNGKTVGIQDSFLAADQDYQPEGVDKPLRPRRNITHAPAHRGCDCQITQA